MRDSSAFNFWLNAGTGNWTLLIRILLFGVFFFEGIQKLIFPEILGAGRFAKIGIPYPEVTGPFVGWVELICGIFILIGFISRPAAALLIITMLVAIFTTKIPILLGHDWLGFSLRELSRYGFWSFAHETRTDWAMLLSAMFVMIAGPGASSLDRVIFRKRKETK